MQGDRIVARVTMWSTVTVAATAIAAGILVAAAPNGRVRAEPDDCRFEQTWYAGDLHFWETLEVRAGATGTWTQGGMDGDAGHDRRVFRWQRTSSTLTVRDERDHEVTVGYRLYRHDDICFLTFDTNPFDREGGFTHFSDVR